MDAVSEALLKRNLKRKKKKKKKEGEEVVAPAKAIAPTGYEIAVGESDASGDLVMVTEDLEY